MDILAGDLEIVLPPDEEDPHVRIVGNPEAVRVAGAMVRQELEPHNKVTMKMDVSWTHHSHIIGKGGNTIQPVVKRTGVSIHFPDGNKNSEVRKSNQVSINSRGEELSGLEDARGAIRELTPLVFSFSLSANAQFINISDPNMLIFHVQNTYNVQVDLKLSGDVSPLIIGSVRGSEWDAPRVKEATLFILQAYCDSLANQMPVQMTVEISPQHHSFVLGRNNENLKRIMQRTATKITFPDSNDLSLPPLKKSTITISGAIDNVYLARQNIVGSLPLVLMFDLMPDHFVDSSEVAQIMQTLDVHIIIKNKRSDGRRPVIIKGAEKNAGNIYEAWRLLSQLEKAPPKARIPPNYHISEAAPLYGLSTDLNLSCWLGGGSGGSSPLPSPTATPGPQGLPNPIWNQAPATNSTLPAHLARSQYNTFMFDPSNYYAANLLLRTGGINGCNNNCILPNSSQGVGAKTGLNINAVSNGISGLKIACNDASCGTSSNSGSSLSSPTPSPRNPSPEQMVSCHMGTPSQQTNCNEAEQPSSSDINAISALLTDLDRRAPGCEKKQIEMAAQKLTLSDYSSKKVQAAKAMKEQVSSNPRTPTSNWSGYGFSKSLPGYIIRQKMQESRQMKAAHKGTSNDDWESWHQQQDVTTTEMPPPQNLQNIQYPSRMPKVDLSSSIDHISAHRSPVTLSASNYMDCVLPRPREARSPTAIQNITSVLCDVQLEQYIDVFAAQDVDLPMFLTLDDADLKELGIKIFGHRKKILMAIKDLSSRKPFSHGNIRTGIDCSSRRDNVTTTWE